VFDQNYEMDADTVTIEVIDDAPQVSDIPDTSFVFLDTLVFFLDAFVTDCDHRPDELEWEVRGNVNIQVTIDQDHVASMVSPSGWTGSELLTFEVSDPDVHLASDGAMITVWPQNDVSGSHGFPSAPDAVILFQNYPNPFNARTGMRYQIADDGYPIQTTLKIYNVLGQEVRVLVDEIQEAGVYRVDWDGKNHIGRSVPSGMYYTQLKAGSRIQTRSLVLLR
jgi:hypothetical protein